MLTSIIATASGKVIGGRIAAPSRRARRTTGAGPLSSPAITANSSPPSRATRSLRRIGAAQPGGDLDQGGIAGRDGRGGR